MLNNRYFFRFAIIFFTISGFVVFSFVVVGIVDLGILVGLFIDMLNSLAKELAKSG